MNDISISHNYSARSANAIHSLRHLNLPRHRRRHRLVSHFQQIGSRVDAVHR
ncbi:MAG: hypothetical protein O2890_11095 [Cyanobacteria bacterium]|nr:hypothetical protein [Cyanobacteriota bacterium]MDA0866940.1 hypothetical protein [Cyanobacteriota bacterium]